MKVKIVGKKLIDFVNRETGEAVSGCELHYLYTSKVDAADFEGEKTGIAKTFDKRLLSAFKSINVGSNVNIDTEQVNNRSIIVDIYEVK